jgi:glycerol-3-phosphate O-acyltransferase/dihydroxyacetone phosphate acyltransferase
MLVSLRIFFKKVHFHNLKEIPKNTPLLIAANHHNSFLDGIVLTILLKQRLHILSRGDVFNTPFKKWLLSQFYLLPIYRKGEAKDNIQKNQESFGEIKKVLAKGHSVLIFPEGISVQEKRLQLPLKKGIARMSFFAAFESEEKVNFSILPMGINFTNPTKLRSDIIISAGTPIPIETFEDNFNENPSLAGYKLVKQIEAQLNEQVIIIDNKANDTLSEAVLTIYRNGFKWTLGWLKHKSERFKDEKRIANWVNKGVPDALRKNIALYFKELSEYGISDLGLYRSQKNGFNLFLILLFPIYILGWVYRMGIGRQAKRMTENKVKLIEFYSSVYLSLGMILHLLQGLILAIIFSITLGKLGLIIWLSWAVSGWLSTHYAYALQGFLQQFKAKKLKKTYPDKWNNLLKKRQNIHTALPKHYI